MSIMWNMINKLFPLTKVVISNCDKDQMTPQIKILIADRQKAHLSQNFDLRDHYAKKVKQEIKRAKNNHNSSMTETLLNLKPNAKEWYQHLAKMTNNSNRKNLILNNIPELALKSTTEIVNTINNHFGVICQTYPLVEENFAANDNLFGPDLKLISEFDTYKLIKKFSKKSFRSWRLSKKNTK